MNRVQKRCLIGSATFHLLLLGILLFGSAFLEPGDKSPPVQAFHVFDSTQVTDALTSGGNPNVTQPLPPAPVAAPTPPQPVNVPTPPTPPTPQVTHREPTPPEPLPRRTEQAEEPPTPTQHHVVLDPNELKPIKRSQVKQPKDSDASDAKRKALEARKLRIALGIAADRIDKGTASHLPTVEEQAGPGGGGPLSMNYRDAVASIYTDAWSPPADLDDESATVVVSVTIDRDGNVMSGHIIKPSGNAAMDQSIQNTLDKVTFVKPFPAGTTEQQRTFTIKFNLQAKRSLG
jgi:TonB family protein